MAHQDITYESYVEKIDKLIPTQENPRSINKKAYESLKKSLRDFPEMKQLREIVVDENLQILGGHQRIYALKDLGYEEVYVKKVTGLSESKKREFIIKDNTSSGEWDTDIIANRWDIEELAEWGVPSFKLGDESNLDEDPKDNKSEKEVECPECGCLVKI